MNRLRTQQQQTLDEVDEKILQMVRADARVSLAEMARRLNRSKSAVKYRLDSLVEQGVIKSFFALVDSKYYGYQLSVVFDLTIEPQLIQEAANKLSKCEEVVRVYELTTTPQLHVHVLFKNHNDMEDFMRNKLYQLPGIKDVNTGFIIKRYKTDLTLQI